jgi:hypothetical protein
VASRTLTSLDWSTARLLEGDAVEAVRGLKATDGGELQVHGSAGLIQTLLAADLVDELRIILFPVVVGEGKRLFGDGAVPRTWRLESSSTSTTGALMCSYRYVGELRTGLIGARRRAAGTGPASRGGSGPRASGGIYGTGYGSGIQASIRPAVTRRRSVPSASMTQTALAAPSTVEKVQ